MEQLLKIVILFNFLLFPCFSAELPRFQVEPDVSSTSSLSDLLNVTAPLFVLDVIQFKLVAVVAGVGLYRGPNGSLSLRFAKTGFDPLKPEAVLWNFTALPNSSLNLYEPRIITHPSFLRPLHLVQTSSVWFDISFSCSENQLSYLYSFYYEITDQKLELQSAVCFSDISDIFRVPLDKFDPYYAIIHLNEYLLLQVDPMSGFEKHCDMPKCKRPLPRLNCLTIKFNIPLPPTIPYKFEGELNCSAEIEKVFLWNDYLVFLSKAEVSPNSTLYIVECHQLSIAFHKLQTQSIAKKYFEVPRGKYEVILVPSRDSSHEAVLVLQDDTTTSTLLVSLCFPPDDSSIKITTLHTKPCNRLFLAYYYSSLNLLVIQSDIMICIVDIQSKTLRVKSVEVSQTVCDRWASVHSPSNGSEPFRLTARTSIYLSNAMVNYIYDGLQPKSLHHVSFLFDVFFNIIKKYLEAEDYSNYINFMILFLRYHTLSRMHKMSNLLNPFYIKTRIRDEPFLQSLLAGLDGADPYYAAFRPPVQLTFDLLQNWINDRVHQIACEPQNGTLKLSTSKFYPDLLKFSKMFPRILPSQHIIDFLFNSVNVPVLFLLVILYPNGLPVPSYRVFLDMFCSEAPRITFDLVEVLHSDLLSTGVTLYGTKEFETVLEEYCYPFMELDCNVTDKETVNRINVAHYLSYYGDCVYIADDIKFRENRLHVSVNYNFLLASYRMPIVDEDSLPPIDRNNIMMSSLPLLTMSSWDVLDQCEVKFLDEYGVDGGGLTREFLTLLTTAIGNVGLLEEVTPLFLGPDDSQSTPNSESFFFPLFQKHALGHVQTVAVRFLGRVHSLAIRRGAPVEYIMPPYCYKLLLDTTLFDSISFVWEDALHAIQFIDRTRYTYFTEILGLSDDAIIEANLYFEQGVQVCDAHHLEMFVSCSVFSFFRGFDEYRKFFLRPPELVNQVDLSPSALQKMIHGETILSAATLLAKLEFTEDETCGVNVKESFEMALYQLESEELLALLAFWTGSRRLPPQTDITLHVMVIPNTTKESIPTSSTCTYSLFIGPYVDPGNCLERIQKALEFHSGFLFY